VVAALFFALLISPKAREIVYTIFRKITKSITDLKFYPALKTKIQRFFTEPINKVLAVLFRFISNVSVYFKKAEEFFSGKMLPLIIEPVNIASLLIRKVYSDSQTVNISIMTGLIVAFYFILTIF
jgi:hypothetical protein